MARLIWAHSRIDAQIGDLRAGRESQGGCYLERERVVYMRELSFVGNYCRELTKHLNFPALTYASQEPPWRWKLLCVGLRLPLPWATAFPRP